MPVHAVDETIPNAWTPVAPVQSTNTVAAEVIAAEAISTSTVVETMVAPLASPPAATPMEHFEARHAVESTPPARVEPQAAPRHVPEVPRVSLELPPESGLVLVETSRDRVSAAAPMEAPPAPRPQRIRPPRQVLAEEPLQLVETQKGMPPA